MPLSGRFAAVRVRPAHRDTLRSKPRAKEWFPVERPEGDAEPAKYWLATPPPETPFAQLVDLAKLRWRIERDHHELKQEIGLGHYEGRGGRLSPSRHARHRRLRIPHRGEGSDSPSAYRSQSILQAPARPDDYRLRGTLGPA